MLPESKTFLRVGWNCSYARQMVLVRCQKEDLLLSRHRCDFQHIVDVYSLGLGCP